MVLVAFLILFRFKKRDPVHGNLVGLGGKILQGPGELCLFVALPALHREMRDELLLSRSDELRELSQDPLSELEDPGVVLEPKVEDAPIEEMESGGPERKRRRPELTHPLQNGNQLVPLRLSDEEKREMVVMGIFPALGGHPGDTQSGVDFFLNLFRNFDAEEEAHGSEDDLVASSPDRFDGDVYLTHLLPEGEDVHVDVPCGHLHLFVELADELFPGRRRGGVLVEVVEDHELPGREVDRDSVFHDGVGLGDELEPHVHEIVLEITDLGVGVVHPNQELFVVEGLGDVVVGPTLEPLDDLIGLVVSGHHEHGRELIFQTNGLYDIDALDPGEVPVEEIDAMIRAIFGGEKLLGGFEAMDRVVVTLEQLLEGVEDVFFVFNNYDGFVHRVSLVHSLSSATNILSEKRIKNCR